jgi:hypothetical protein
MMTQIVLFITLSCLKVIGWPFNAFRLEADTISPSHSLLKYIMLLFCYNMGLLALLASNGYASDVNSHASHPSNFQMNGGIHLPLLRRELTRVRRHDDATLVVGLGDFNDM